MKYYLDSSSLAILQEVRSEVIDNINGRTMPVAIRNEFVIRFNVWLDAQTQAIYATGVDLPGELPTVVEPNLVFN